MGDRSARGRSARRGGGVAALVGVAAVALATSAGGVTGPAVPPAAGSADLALTMSDSPDPVSAAGALTYAVEILNAGPDGATNVVFTDRLPKGAGFVGADPSQGTCGLAARAKPTKGTLRCALGTVAAGVGTAPSAVTIAVHLTAPTKGGDITNAASVSSDVGDPDHANDTASETTTVVAPAPRRCQGKEATVVGTAGADVLSGSSKADVIVGLGGDDEIAAADGRDRICAGAGDDRVRSGARSDHVRGGPGRDRLRGQAGDDVLRAGPG